MLEKQLKTLFNFVSNEMNDLLEQSLTAVDLTVIGEMIMEDKTIGTLTMEEALFYILSIAQYVETDTVLESPISDELYDNLHAKYVELTGHGITGTNNTSGSNKPLRHHKYPELRGTLGKVHFINMIDVPKKDSRKSYEDFLSGVDKKCGIGLKRIPIAYALKYDGLSAVFECKGDTILNVLTRKDTENNLGVDISHVFKTIGAKSIIHPKIELPDGVEYGIKTEIYMTQENFDKFKQTVVKPPKNRRSAVSMILNTMEEDYNPEWVNYLTIMPLQIAVAKKLDVPEISFIGNSRVSNSIIFPIGQCNDRYQYIVNTPQIIYDECIPDQLDILAIEIANVQYIADQQGIPVDGVVCTILDDDIIKTLGRKENKNQFQIAYKIPAGVKKTTLIDVEFQVGPVAGTITPVAIVEPVVIMGNTINSPGLSNLAKLNRLDLNVGDEVFIKYDIVPTLYKDDTCKKGNGKHIDPITNCPICGEPLNITDDLSQARCMNMNCSSKVSGKIYNFINKIGIPNIGLSTVELLVERGFLETPADLYRLIERRNELITIPGFGATSVENMVKSISSKRSVYAHELFGSLGIPDVGRRTMKKITDDGSVQLMDLLIADNDIVINKLSNIKGIGEATAIKICQGVLTNRDLIHDLLRYIDIKAYEEDTTEYPETVLFTKIRDPKFAEYLKSSGQANVSDSYNKSVTIVIVPDIGAKTSKVDKAIKDGKTVLPIREAYTRFGYTGRD